MADKPLTPSLRGATGSRECAPDDRLRDEAIQSCFAVLDCFASLAMTKEKGRDCSRPSLLSLRQPQFEARFGGLAGHDLIRVS
jgi:hypothetical protein